MSLCHVKGRDAKTSESGIMVLYSDSEMCLLLLYRKNHGSECSFLFGGKSSSGKWLDFATVVYQVRQ